MVITKNTLGIRFIKDGYATVTVREDKNGVIRSKNVECLTSGKPDLSSCVDDPNVIDGHYAAFTKLMSSSHMYINLDKSLEVFGDVEVEGNLTYSKTLIIHGSLMVNGNISCKPNIVLYASSIECKGNISAGPIHVLDWLTAENVKATSITAGSIDVKGTLKSLAYITSHGFINATDIKSKFDISAENDINCINIKTSDGIICNELNVNNEIDIKEGITTLENIYCGGEIKIPTKRKIIVNAHPMVSDKDTGELYCSKLNLPKENIIGATVYETSQYEDETTLHITKEYPGVYRSLDGAYKIPRIVTTKNVVIDLGPSISALIERINTTGSLTVNNDCTAYAEITAFGDIEFTNRLYQASDISSKNGNITIGMLTQESDDCKIIAKSGTISIAREV